MNKEEIIGLCEFLKIHGYENIDNISKFIFELEQENKKLNGAIQTYDILLKSSIEENQDLKKQIENNIKINIADHKYASKCEDKVITLEAHQKEFIKYLEDEIESYELTSDLIFNHNKEMKIYKDILQKYKSIIGVEDENKRN